MCFEVDPIDLHYMTDRHERFDQKIYQIETTAEAKTPMSLDALEVS